MRLMSEADRPAIEAYLRRHASHMMFPWSNLWRHGMGGDHPRAMTFWMSADGVDLLGMTNEGMIMPYCPNTADHIGPLLAGRQVKGLLGETTIVERMRRALNLAPAALDGSEPHYELDLDALVMPDVAGLKLHPLDHAPRALLHEWRAAYSVESLAVPGEDAGAKAVSDISDYLANDTHRVLTADSVPVAMTGFNATAPGVVQIGGVYTPPPLRARGYARAALALHLEEVRSKGTARAFLFAANEPAERAYRAIGFRQIGRFSVIVYETPQDV